MQPKNTGFDFKNADWFSHDPGPRSPVRVFNSIQAKLTVGAPNDVYEQEADRVAEQVMSTPESAVQQPIQREAMPEEKEELQTKSLGDSIQREAMPKEEEELQTKPLAATITPLVQREAMSEEEEELQTKALGDSIQREAMPEEEEEEIQTKPSLQRATDGNLQAGSNLESQLSNSKGGGSPLPDDIRTFMEPRFGADFSQVRVHTGSEAIQMNQDVNAQAFTHGQDVYFGAGKAPGKNNLTAHELTHVVQQTGSVQRQPKISAVPQTSLIQRVAPAAGGLVAGLGAALTTDAAANAATLAGTVLAAGTSAAQAGAMSGGVQAVQLENGWMSNRDQRNLEILTQYRLINAYIDRYKQQHPDQFTIDSRRSRNGVIEFTEPIVIVSNTSPQRTPAVAAANPSGGAVDQAIMDAVKSQVQLGITEDLNGNQKTAGIKEYIWSDSGDHTPDVIGTVGAVQFSQVKGTFLSETLTLSHAAKQVPGLNPPAENTQVNVRQFRGGVMRRGPTMSIGYGDSLTINLVGTGPISDQAANNQHGKHTYATDWNWDGNTTQGNFTVFITEDGTPIFDEPDWQSTPDDNSWI